MNDITLYHGSKNGLQSPIQPNSRSRCDFGKGFYMSTTPMQPKTLIYRHENPTFYTLKLRISEIPEDRILKLSGRDWMLSVLYHRKYLKDIKQTDMYKQIKAMNQDKDLIIGPIADDRMNEVINNFTENLITNKVLLECLKYIDYGTQYVAKTKFACSKIKIISQETLDTNARKKWNELRKHIRQESYEKIRQINRQYRKDGQTLDEILTNEKEKLRKQCTIQAQTTI